MPKAKTIALPFKNAAAGAFGRVVDMVVVLSTMLGLNHALMNAFVNALNKKSEAEFEPNPQNMYQYEFLALLRTCEDINAMKAEHKVLFKNALIERLDAAENDILKPEKIKMLISAALRYVCDHQKDPVSSDSTEEQKIKSNHKRFEYSEKMVDAIYNDINLRFYDMTDAQFQSDGQAFYEWQPAGDNSGPRP